MSSDRFRARNRAIAANYDALAKRYGDSPRAAQWRGQASQDRRFEVLFRIGDLTEAKILDFGCGTAALLAALRKHYGYRGDYFGSDISNRMLKIAREKFPEARFGTFDIFEEPPAETFDYVFASGVFNNGHADAYDFLQEALPRLFRLAHRGVGFNLLSALADRQITDLIYLDPHEVVDWARREITPHVTLIDDYRIDDDEPVPEDFTVFLKRE